uniref:Large ribosomal subunit protein bL32c n=1 Tax=Monotropa hypopitys var. americana TaxID=1862694 RepID=A0A221SQZ0_9ERIC|nr:ribosomal protein L32 [Monotropa hypopitys var. americana]
MGVPKKRKSISKKSIRKNIWKRKGFLAYLKAFSLGKSFLAEHSKIFLNRQKSSTASPRGFFIKKKRLY